MIVRLVGLYDYLDVSYGVIGRYLVVVLFYDLYEIGKVVFYVFFEDFLGEMKLDKIRFKIVGVVILKLLIKLLIIKRRIEIQMIFLSLCRFLEKNIFLVEDIVQVGFQEFNLKYFLVVSIYDCYGNMILVWFFYGNFWNIVID